MMAIVSSMLVERTERGDEMFMAMLRRHSQHVLDTDALATLPEPAAPEALQPSADDEGAHQPGAEPLWSESWYADFVDEAAGRRRLVPAGPDPQPEHGVDQRAAVRTRHAHRRRERLRGRSCPTTPASFAPMPSNSPTRPPNRCRPTT